MKRIYWLLIAAVPVMLWWLSQGGSHQEAQQATPDKPEPDKAPSAPETTPEAVKDLPTSSNGTFPKAAAPTDTTAPAEAAAPAEATAPAAAEAPTPVVVESAVVESPSPEQIQEAAETAPPIVPQIEVAPAAPAAAGSGETIQVFDSQERALDCQLLEITSSQALVRCPEALPEKEKARLVLPFGDAALTVNGQLVAVEDGVSRFKIMTMKAGQKKRFEDYLSQRLGL